MGARRDRSQKEESRETNLQDTNKTMNFKSASTVHYEAGFPVPKSYVLFDLIHTQVIYHVSLIDVSSLSQKLFDKNNISTATDLYRSSELTRLFCHSKLLRNEERICAHCLRVEDQLLVRSAD